MCVCVCVCLCVCVCVCVCINICSYVGPPDEPSRAEIFTIELRKLAVAPDVCALELASLSGGLSGAEIAAVCREAALAAMAEDLNALAVGRRHFLSAVTNFTPRITPDMHRFYARYKSTSGLTSID